MFSTVEILAFSPNRKDAVVSPRENENLVGVMITCGID